MRAISEGFVCSCTSDCDDNECGELWSDRILLFGIHYVYHFHFWIGSRSSRSSSVRTTHHHFSCAHNKRIYKILYNFWSTRWKRFFWFWHFWAMLMIMTGNRQRGVLRHEQCAKCIILPECQKILFHAIDQKLYKILQIHCLCVFVRARLRGWAYERAAWDVEHHRHRTSHHELRKADFKCGIFGSIRRIYGVRICLKTIRTIPIFIIQVRLNIISDTIGDLPSRNEPEKFNGSTVRRHIYADAKISLRLFRIFRVPFWSSSMNPNFYLNRFFFVLIANRWIYYWRVPYFPLWKSK